MKQRHVACLVLALSLALPVSSAMALEVVAAPKLSAKDTVSIFERRYAKTLKVLQADFPADYEELMAFAAEVERSNVSDDEKLSAQFKALTQLRKKYADSVVYAPDDALERVLGLLGEFYQEVLNHEGPLICGQFASNGSGVLFQQKVSATYAGRLDAQSEAYFNAVVQSIENPSFRKPIEKDDWMSVSQSVVDAGGSINDLMRIAKGDPRDPSLCSSLSTFFLMIAQIRTDEGGRIRADFAHNVTGY
jgi:hypothetical protein